MESRGCGWVEDGMEMKSSGEMVCFRFLCVCVCVCVCACVTMPFSLFGYPRGWAGGGGGRRPAGWWQILSGW